MAEMFEPGREQEDRSGLLHLSGTIERVIYVNEENGYAICDMGCEGDEDIVTIVGTIPYIAEGDSVEVYGRWIHNPKYGRQFKVENYEKKLPSDCNAILRYLASGAIRGIGPKTAMKIVDEFREDSFDVIENHPDWLAQIPGITPKRAREMSEDFKTKSGMRSVMMYFREYFGAATTVKIYKKWGSASIDLVKKNPYRLCEEIEGIGFERVDAIAAQFCGEIQSADRLVSGFHYLLTHNAVQNGHVCLPEDKLIAAATSLLQATADEVREAVTIGLSRGTLRKTEFGGVCYYYEREAYDCETFIARKLALLDQMCAAVSTEDVGIFIRREEARSSMQYAALQKKAIHDALTSGVLILTGGPGTGKTTIVRALLEIFESMGFRVALAAPTGRAAKRLSESTSRDAKTIHRLLEMEYSGENSRAEFVRNETYLLEENVIIIDEASMVDNALMCALLKAIKLGARLIVIGDADQLPSIGAGNVLRDLLESGRFSSVRLDEIFRQARESLIVTNAHAINSGCMPRLDAKDKDFFYLARNSEAEIAFTVAQLYKERLPRTYGADTVGKIQVISPSRRGEAGTENLNRLLQQALNPPARGKAEYRFRDVIYRVGDRVMQIRNNYDIEWVRGRNAGTGVFNGDIGVIVDMDPVAKEMEIVFEDKHVMYDFTQLDELEHAYAVTVHKSQGSEYPIVIMPLYRAPQMLLTRHLFYTAVTRAERMVILVGRPEIIETMVSNNVQAMRYTGLAKRLAVET